MSAAKRPTIADLRRIADAGPWDVRACGGVHALNDQHIGSDYVAARVLNWLGSADGQAAIAQHPKCGLTGKAACLEHCSYNLPKRPAAPTSSKRPSPRCRICKHLKTGHENDTGVCWVPDNRGGYCKCDDYQPKRPRRTRKEKP